MVDLIDRQAVLDAIGDVHPLDHNANAILSLIKKIPSAQTERRRGKWVISPDADDMIAQCSECKSYIVISVPLYFCPVCGADMRADEGGAGMTDLISRKAAIKAIEDLQDCYNGFSDTYDKACIIGVLEEVPSAQPEIIRCKDCKHWVNHKRLNIPWCRDLHIDRGAEDFCSMAERRE